MTHAAHIAEEDVKLELSQLWMLPLILFQMICSFFANERRFIRDHRRKRSSLTNWEDHILDLVEAEWNIDALKAEGARRLLAGDPLDFQTIRIPPPPDDWQPLVQDAADLLRRFEAVAGFHADPETYIRRHAARISDRARRDPLRLDASHRSTSPGLRPVEAIGTANTDLAHRTVCLPMSRSDRRGHRAALTIARSCARDGGGWLNTHPP